MPWGQRLDIDCGYPVGDSMQHYMPRKRAVTLRRPSEGDRIQGWWPCRMKSLCGHYKMSHPEIQDIHDSVMGIAAKSNANSGTGRLLMLHANNVPGWHLWGWTIARSPSSTTAASDASKQHPTDGEDSIILGRAIFECRLRVLEEFWANFVRSRSF